MARSSAASPLPAMFACGARILNAVSGSSTCVRHFRGAAGSMNARRCCACMLNPDPAACSQDCCRRWRMNDRSTHRIFPAVANPMPRRAAARSRTMLAQWGISSTRCISASSTCSVAEQVRWWRPSSHSAGHRSCDDWRSFRRRSAGATTHGRRRCPHRRILQQQLHNGPAAQWIGIAAHDYEAGERLPLIRQPILLARFKDDVSEHGARARQLLRTARSLDLPEGGAGLLVSAPQVIARQLREFLDGH